MHFWNRNDTEIKENKKQKAEPIHLDQFHHGYGVEEVQATKAVGPRGCHGDVGDGEGRRVGREDGVSWGGGG